jgi:hypothetical protein
MGWALGGTLAVMALLVVVIALRPPGGVPEQYAMKTLRLGLAAQIRYALASAAEAEKSAVLAITDEDSKKYADEARAATAQAEDKRKQLADSLSHGTAREKELLDKFTDAFTQYRKIDQEVLELAVKNTNLKASALAFGAAADAVTKTDEALSGLVAKSANPKVVRLAAGADAAMLRIQALLPPHIAEESDAKMDALEARMKAQDDQAQKDLKELATAASTGERAAVDIASASYATFTGLRQQILKLSRENTNVRSLQLSLNEKRKATLVCQDALETLTRILEEEPTGLRKPVSPR